MGLLALLLLGDDSSSSSSDTGTDITSGFPSELHEVIAYAVEHNHSDNLVSLAFDPWKRLSGAGKVELQGKDTIKFAIVPKTGTMADASLVPIGSYTMPDGKSGGVLSFTSLTSSESGIGAIEEKEAMGFVAVAATVKEVSDATNAGKLLKATKSEIADIVTAAGTGTASGSGDSAKTALQDAIEKAITSLKTKIDESTDSDLTAAIKTALKASATTANGKAKALAAAAKAAIAKKEDPGTAAGGKAPTATLTVNTDNATVSLKTLDVNVSQTVKLTVSSSNITSPVYFLYTATEQGTKTILLTNATKSTAVKLNKTTYEGYMNLTSTYVYTLAACKTGTETPDANCQYDTKKVQVKPTVVVTSQTDLSGDSRAVLKINLAAHYLDSKKGWGSQGGWSLDDAGVTGNFGKVGFGDNVTITQVPDTGKDLNTQGGTLTIVGPNSDLSLMNGTDYSKGIKVFDGEISLTTPYAIPTRPLRPLSNVSGTIRVTACSPYKYNSAPDKYTSEDDTACVSNTFTINSNEITGTTY